MRDEDQTRKQLKMNTGRQVTHHPLLEPMPSQQACSCVCAFLPISRSVLVSPNFCASSSHLAVSNVKELPSQQFFCRVHWTPYQDTVTGIYHLSLHARLVLLRQERQKQKIFTIFGFGRSRICTWSCNSFRSRPVTHAHTHTRCCLA